MGILEKLGLVEDETTETVSETPISVETMAIPAVDPTILTNISGGELHSVTEIYDQTGLADVSKSIYKVEELKNALPASLDLQSVKQSVLGVMKVAGLVLEEVIADSGQRINVLQATALKMADETEAVITNNLTEITGLEARVNELKQINSQKKKLQEEQGAVIQDEIAKIEAIVKFIS